MVGYLPFSLLSAAASLHLVRAVPADPADPTITPAAVLPLRLRQQDAAFIGYLNTDGVWSSEACNSGLTWYENGDYAQCCPTTLASCPAATACMSGSQVYPLPDLSMTTTIACTENYGSSIYSFCNTILIYENTLDSKPKTNINCGNKNVRWSYYRSVDTKTAVGSATDNDSDSDSGTQTGIGSKASGTSSNSSSSSSEKSSSKAWIAGAVVGPIIGLALIGLAVFCLLRRKKKSKPTTIVTNNNLPPQQGTAMAPNPTQPPAGVAGYTDSKPTFSSPHQSYYDPAHSTPTYPQQGGFNANGGDVSPSPAYASPVTYSAPSPPPMAQHGQPVYGAPGGDAKMQHTPAPTNGAAELGGESTAAPVSPVAGGRPVSYAPQGNVGHGQGAPVYGAELQGSVVGR